MWGPQDLRFRVLSLGTGGIDLMVNVGPQDLRFRVLGLGTGGIDLMVNVGAFTIGFEGYSLMV